MKVRKFKREDARAVSKIMVEAFRSFLGDKMNELTLKSFSPNRLKKISHSKGDDCETVSYVAEEKGEIVGYIRGSASLYGLGTLAVVGISLSHLHKGIGTRLIKELEKFWRKRKMRKVSTCVSAHNTRALIYYLRNGFIPVGYQKDHFREGVDEIILDRFLKQNPEDEE